MTRRVRAKGRGGAALSKPEWVTGNALLAYEDKGIVFPVRATGNPLPTLAVSSGTLPSGLTFTDLGGGRGTFSGIVASVGNTSVTLTATNSQGSKNLPFFIGIGADPNPPSDDIAPDFTTPAAFLAVEDTPALFVVHADGNPAPAMSLTSGTLPTGLTFSDIGGGTATIGGIPTTVQNRTINVHASNTEGTDDQSVFIGIGQAPPVDNDVAPVIESGTLILGVENKPVLFIIAATGSPTPTFTISGDLHAGLEFKNLGGGNASIGGTPTEFGTRDVIVTATNRKGQTSKTITVGIAEEVDPPDPHLYLVDDAIDHTGATDVTAQLLAFIASVPDGTITTPNVIRFRAGTYKVEGRLYIRDRRYLVFDGSLGAKIKRAGTGRVDNNPQGTILNCDIFTFNYGRGIVVYDLEIEGGNDTVEYFAIYETQHGIRWRGVIGAEVSNCNIHHTYGDAVYAGFGQIQAGIVRPAELLWVHDNDVHHTGRQVLSPSIGVRDIVFEANFLHDARRAAVDIEPLATREDVIPIDDSLDADAAGKNGAYGCWILDNRMDSIRLSCMAHKGSGYAHTIIWKGNYTTDTKLDGWFGASDIGSGDNKIDGPTRHYLWIHDNVFDVIGIARPIQIQRYHGVDIRGNTLAVQVRNTTFRDGTTSGNRAFDANFCKQVASGGNTIDGSGAPSSVVHVSNLLAGGTPIATTAPTPPDAGAPYALRSTGGWLP